MPKNDQIFGHAAPRPTLGELIATRSELNRVRADFLKSDLETGMTFVQIARQTENESHRKRSCRAARRAYDTVAKLAQKAGLTKQDSAVVRQGLAQLQKELRALGETF